MSSMRLFNKEFLFQNIKKSLGPLSVFVCLFPILNFMYLLFAGVNNVDGYVYSMSEISVFNYFGIFIIPLVLSICLFGYIFKKKSVDFINSMPLSRSTLFITNSIGGVIIIFLMMIVNILFLLIISICFSSSIIPFNLLLDYFAFWFISYTFVFMASNIAVSVSGNAITSIVVTALILFLIPYTTDYINIKADAYNYKNVYVEFDSDDIDNYSCYNDEVCKSNLMEGRYLLGSSNSYKNDYTVPYSFVHSALYLDGSITDFSISQIFKMFILSLIYFVIGLVCYNKRKMENCEVSFKSIHVHSIVKCLTMVPIITFLYEIFNFDLVSSSVIVVLFLLVLILAYYFIYDLITKRGIKDIKISLLYFVSCIFVLVLFCTIGTLIFKDKKHYVNTDDIKLVSLELRDSSKFSIEDKEIIKELVKLGIEGDSGSDFKSITVIYSIGSNRVVKTLTLSSLKYNELLSKLNDSEILNDSINNSIKHYNDAFVINNIVSKVDSDLRDILNSIDINFNDYYNNVSNCSIQLYEYTDHRWKNVIVPCSSSDELQKYISSLVKNRMKNILNSNLIQYISLSGEVEDDYILKYNYISNDIESELIKYLKNNIGVAYDLSKPYYEFGIYANNDYYFVYTNNIEEVNEIIDAGIKEVENTKDYIDYIKDSSEGDKHE